VFGRGWSSTVDMSVRENPNADGVVETATVRYPTGQEVNFGRNNDGTWVSPPGRFSVFAKLADNSAFTLTDKDGTTYEFGHVAGGLYRITRITDASQRSLTVTYDSDGRAEVVRSVTSGRTLTFSWVTPPGAGHPHVATVTTDPVDPADPTTSQTWTYNYAQDRLVSVCPPGTTTACTAYDHRNVAQFQNTVLQHDPYSFWRLNETGGEVARSSVLSNDGTDDAAAVDLAYGVTGPLGGSASTAAGFNGTSSRVKLPVRAQCHSA
jgi:YD repeat-containing protein